LESVNDIIYGMEGVARFFSKLGGVACLCLGPCAGVQLCLPIFKNLYIIIGAHNIHLLNRFNLFSIHRMRLIFFVALAFIIDIGIYLIQG
jgi:hypothetical protein